MFIQLWGVRGSISAPLRNVEYHAKIQAILKKSAQAQLQESQIEEFIKELPLDLRYTFGGDTTCISVSPAASSGAKIPVIVDAGTGIRNLGDELMEGPCGEGKGEVHILLTHTHWDHIQGLPFFKPIYIPGNQIHFHSPYPDVKERLIYQQESRFFPMHFEGTASTKHFHSITQGNPIQLEGMMVDPFPMRHPGGSYAYRFRQNGHTFIFATDAEFTGEDLEKPQNYIDFFGHCDLIVLDSQYTLDEHFKKFDWGHTSYNMAVNIAVSWKVKNLVLTHHEPAYSDSKLYENLQEAIEHRNLLKQENPRIFLAREGMVFQVGEK